MVLKFHQLYLFQPSEPATDKKTKCKSLALEEQLADKSIRSMCQCALVSDGPSSNRMFTISEPS